MEVERVEAGVEDVEERRCGRVVEEVVEGRRVEEVVEAE